jgi:hypothetical protein
MRCTYLYLVNNNNNNNNTNGDGMALLSSLQYSAVTNILLEIPLISISSLNKSHYVHLEAFSASETLRAEGFKTLLENRI